MTIFDLLKDKPDTKIPVFKTRVVMPGEGYYKISKWPTVRKEERDDDEED